MFNSRSVIALLLLCALTACSYPATETNFTFTVVAEVHTPQALKTGKSAISVHRIDYENENWCSWMCPAPPSKIVVKGEALAVDLSANQTLFILLTSNQNDNWIANSSYAIENELKIPRCYKNEVFRQHDIDGDGCLDVLTHVELPYFVTFEDNQKFGSITEVDPWNLSKSFGSGVKLKSLKLRPGGQTKSEIFNRLPWGRALVQAPKYSFVLAEKDNFPPFPNGIGRQSFKQELQ